MADDNNRDDKTVPPATDKLPEPQAPVTPIPADALKTDAATPLPAKPEGDSKFTQMDLFAPVGATEAPQTAPKANLAPATITTTDAAPETAPPVPTGEVKPATVVPPVNAEKPAAPADGTTAAPLPTGEAPAGDKAKEKAATVADAEIPKPEETEEEREARLKAEQAEAIKKAATAKPLEVKPPQTEAEKAAIEAQQQQDAAMNMATQKYRAIYEKRGYMSKMNGEWGVADVDDELKKALGETGTIEDNKKYGLDFKLPTGQTIEWHRNMGGSEFIGMTRKTATFDMNAAHAVIATSKSRGWPSVNVHGSVEQKDMMWLEAQRQGLEVVNHQPALNSQYRRMWDEEAQKRLDENTAGARPSTHPTPNIPAKGLKQSDEAPAEMQVPAQVDTASMEAGKKDIGKFVKADALPNGGEPVEAGMTEKDQQLAFIARKMEQHKDDPVKLKGLQDMKDAIEGRSAAPVLDGEITSDATKEGLKLPVAQADAGKTPGAPKAPDIPEGSLSLSSYLDRELKNPKNSAEVTQGLQEMKGALDEGRIKEGDVDVARLKTDAGGVVTRDQYAAIAEGLEEKNPETKKFSRPATAAAAGGETPAVAVAEVVVAGNTVKKTVTAGAPKAT